MITLEDCIAFCGLTEEEVLAIAEHEPPAKINHARDTRALAYTLEPTTIDGIETARIVWDNDAFEQTACTPGYEGGF